MLWLPLLCAIRKSDSVCNQCNKFRIGGLPFSCIHRITEQRIQRLHTPPAPSHFYSVTYRTFHTAGSCLKTLGNSGIQYLGDGTDHSRVLHRHHNCLSQILIPLDMCRNANLVNHIGHILFQIMDHRLLYFLLFLHLFCNTALRGRHGNHNLELFVCIYQIPQNEFHLLYDTYHTFHLDIL